MGDNQVVRDRVISVLRSPTTRYIDFTFSKWTFNAASFARVAHAVAVGNISISVGGNLHPGAEANYDPDSDTITLPNANYGTTVLGQAGILHECTHAFVDMENRKHSMDSASEAAGYIAYAMYLCYALDSIPDSILPYGLIAMDIAVSLVNDGGGLVSLADEMKLRQAIAADPHYKKYQHMTLTSPFAADGLRRNNP